VDKVRLSAGSVDAKGAWFTTILRPPFAAGIDLARKGQPAALSGPESNVFGGYTL